MGTTWSNRKQPAVNPGGTPLKQVPSANLGDLADRGAEKWAAMRANPVKPDYSAGPVSSPATPSKPKAAPKQRYF